MAQKKILLKFISKTVLPIVSSKSFLVSSLTFKSLIYFVYPVIFVYDVNECSSYIFHM